MPKVYLDTESVGLKGRVLLIQLSLDRKPIRIINNPYNPANKHIMMALRDVLYDPENLIIGYNLGFDLVKLRETISNLSPETRDKPFLCKISDLYQKTVVKLWEEYPVNSHFTVYFSKIHKSVHEIVKEEVLRDLNSFIPSYLGEFKCTVKEKWEGNKDYRDFVDLSFWLKTNLKLKSLVSLIAPKLMGEIQKIEDIFYLPKHAKKNRDGEIIINFETKGGFKENTKVPFPLPDEIEYYRVLEEANKELLERGVTRKKIIKYSKLDIELLWYLEDWLEDNGVSAEPNYNDYCTHMVAETRFYGIPLDIKKLGELKEEQEKRKKEIEALCPINLNSAPQRLEFVRSLIDDSFEADDGDDQTGIQKTDKVVLEGLLKYGLILPGRENKIKGILEYKTITQCLAQIKTFELGGGRLYPNFSVLGTVTERMGGRDGFNGQGVGKNAGLRECVKIKCIGDFDGQETTIYAAWSGDETLNRELGNGVDLHTMNVTRLFPDYREVDYEEAARLKKEGDKEFKECRDRAKAIWFGLLYGSEELKQSEQLGCDLEDIEEYMGPFFAAYKTLHKTRESLRNTFKTVARDIAEGYSEEEARNSWQRWAVKKMGTGIMDVLGATKKCEFEKKIADYLWSNYDKYGDKLEVFGFGNNVIVRDKDRRRNKQTISDSVNSATRGAVIRIQKRLVRQLGNWPIQRSGAVVTKNFMAALWKKFRVRGFNVHDEIVITDLNGHKYEEIKGEIKNQLCLWRGKIKYLSMDFHRGKTWADK